MTEMTRLRATACAAAVSLLVLTGASACSSDNGEEVGVGEDSTGTVVTTTPRSTTVPPAPCNDENLFVAVSTEVGTAAILDRTCSSTAALATLEGEAVPDGIGIGLFTTDDGGTWTLLKIVSLDADLAAELPETFPGSLASAWRKAYDARTASPEDEGPQAGGFEDENPTSTEPPPTEPPPTEPAPEQPAPAPAPTVPPTVPRSGGGGGGFS